jgi:hypothetical protein
LHGGGGGGGGEKAKAVFNDQVMATAGATVEWPKYCSIDGHTTRGNVRMREKEAG